MLLQMQFTNPDISLERLFSLIMDQFIDYVPYKFKDEKDNEFYNNLFSKFTHSKDFSFNELSAKQNLDVFKDANKKLHKLLLQNHLSDYLFIRKFF